ncbi:hypothetical protein DFJ74DRAFT_673869 [Hyaloraphidium curvatum]|nr:hypothetical protein DFJ74DRAFT_673869 [Hyaloraphidium curvatum]
MLVLARAPADIEGAQAMCLMLHVLLIAGLPRKMYAVLQHCANTCDRLWFGLKPGFPTSANAWIYRELVLRLRILVGAFDVSTAFYSGGKMFAHYFYPSTFPLPAGEGFFDHPDPSSAFDAYRSLRRTGEPSMRFGTLDWDAVGRSVAVLAAAPFSGSSVLSLFHYASFARYVRMALSRPTPAFSVFAAQYAALVDSALTSLPPDVSLPLSRGDPLPLLRSPHFPTRAHAHAAVLSLLFADVHAVEAGLSADPSAEQRGEVIARCLRVASAAHALALDDPEGRIANHVLANPAYVVGRVLLAEVAAGRGGKEAVSGVEKVAWCLELYGRCFGLQPRRLAARFAQECLRAGLRQVPQRDPGPAPIGDDPGPAPIDDDPAPRGGEGEARFFAEVLLEGGEGKLGWLPAVRPVAS